MPKPLQTRRVATPDRKGVFGQGGKALHVGLYARVSTHDQKTLPLLAMRDLCKEEELVRCRRGSRCGVWGHDTPREGETHRGVPAAEIDLVLAWRLDRWGRSLVDLVTTLQELNALDVGFVSLCEALDLTTPRGRALAGMLAVLRSSSEIFCGTA